MTTLLEQKLRGHPSPYVTSNQLARLLDGTKDSYKGRIQRAVQAGLLIRIRRGLYVLGTFLTPRPEHPFELAQLIYGPSYISLESALAFHNLIPEAVYTTTCVSIKRNKQFITPKGVFSYFCLPTTNFFLATECKEENDYRFIIATPWKAIFDYIYCYKKNWKSIEPLEQSLRIELSDLPLLNTTLLKQLKHYYRNQRILEFIKYLPKELIDEY